MKPFSRRVLLPIQIVCAVILGGCASVSRQELSRASDLKRGQSPAEVVYLLGVPNNIITMANQDTFYIYDKVRVVFRQGVVTFAFENTTPMYLYTVDALRRGGVAVKAVFLESGNADI